MDEQRVGRRFLIRGRVQQVGFRAATWQRARELGVQGYARNLPDGRVEVLAVGTDDAVASLAEWLHHGPASARVETLEECPPIAFDGDGFGVL